MSIPTKEEVVSEILSLQHRLKLMAKVDPLCNDQDSVHALERAASWLGNITNPITKLEDDLWFKTCALEEAQGYLEDGRAKELARTAIEHGSTDEDKRWEIAQYQEMMDEEDLA